MSDARDELIQRAAARGHRAEAEAYFADRDSKLADEPRRTLGIGITNADGLAFWLGSYNQTTAPTPEYDAVSVSDEEFNRIAAVWAANRSPKRSASPID